MYLFTFSQHISQTRPKEKSLWFLVIGRLQNRCGDVLLCFVLFGNLFLIIFFANREIRDTDMYTWGKISHIYIQSMAAKRGLTNWANVHMPICKKLV